MIYMHITIIINKYKKCAVGGDCEAKKREWNNQQSLNFNGMV